MENPANALVPMEAIRAPIGQDTRKCFRQMERAMTSSRKIFLLLFLLLSLNLTVTAQSQPPKPEPTVQVKLTDGQRTWYQALPVTNRTADKAFIASTLLSLAATVADVENSHAALERSGTREANPLFGSNPSRVRYYAITLPVFAVNAFVSYRYKRQDDALGVARYGGHKIVKWWLPNTLNTFFHVVGISATVASTGK